jgi:hypothetical protein
VLPSLLVLLDCSKLDSAHEKLAPGFSSKDTNDQLQLFYYPFLASQKGRFHSFDYLIPSLSS